MSRPRAARQQYGRAHQLTSQQLVAEHVAVHGWMCPGLPDLVAAHPSTDLVADHNVASRAEFGYTIRCRSCNTRRRNAGLG